MFASERQLPEPTSPIHSRLRNETKMRKFAMLSVLMASLIVVWGQFSSAQERGQQQRGERRPGQQDQQGRGQRGPQRGMQRGGGGISMIGLASIEAVQAEIDMVDDQVKELTALLEKLRNDRGPQRGRNDRNSDEDLSEEEIQAQREERRAQFMEQAAANAKKANEGLKDILLDHQYDRLHEIYVQALGVGALQNEEIAAKLKITEKQKSQIAETTAKARQDAMEEFAKMRGSGDREAMQKMMTELRSQSEAKVMAVLTAKQKSSLEAMKGEAFEIPADALRGRRGGTQSRGRQRGGQRGGDQQRGGDRGNRQQDDDGDLS
jgi:hypothetical protein